MKRGTIDLRAADLAIVRRILRQYLPVGVHAWVFGSRATGTARKFSDLDLAIDAGQPLETWTLAELASDFEESDLPFKVDVLDWQTLDARFRAAIEDQRIALDLGTNPAPAASCGPPA